MLIDNGVFRADKIFLLRDPIISIKNLNTSTNKPENKNTNINQNISPFNSDLSMIKEIKENKEILNSENNLPLESEKNKKKFTDIDLKIIDEVNK